MILKSETSIENIDNEIPEHMVEVINHINHIDTFILNNNYDIHMEKINDYLIDLLFLIKSKKIKNNNFILFNFQINVVEFDMLQQMLIELHYLMLKNYQVIQNHLFLQFL